MSLQSLNTSVYLILALLFVILTESEGTRRSVKNHESIRNGIEELDVPNDSGSLKIESDFGPSLNETGRNSPALNSFLKNVLQAQDELKWIDQAVRRVDARDNPEKVPYRYLRSSFHTPASIYNTRIRFKRRSDPRSYDHEDPWTSTKRRYIYDDHNSDRIYLDNEMKVKKRQAKYPYQEFDYSGYRPLRRRYIGSRRSAVDDNGEPIDDSTLKNWAKKEGLQVPVDWFDSGQSNVEKSYETSGNHYNWPKSDYDDELRDAEGSNVRMNDFNKNVNDWVDNTRDERDAGHSLIRKEAEQPTLESLKKTVLELKKSLENSDKNDEKEGDFGVAKNREKYIRDISGIKKSDDNSPYDQGSNFYDEIDREYRDDPVSSKTDISGGSNWWEDPRSAIDMFEFKKRDDDAEDEDDDEESAPGNSEFDYMMPRVKREKYDDDHENGEKNIVRVYRRAGFGELYHKNEKTEGENAEEINKVGRVQREIREAEGIDKINDERNTDGVKTGKNERVDINENENENGNGNYLREFSEEIKNFGKDNPAKKSAVLKAGENEVVEKVTGTFAGDRNLKEENNAGFISGDEKRSSSLRDREEKNEPRFSADYSSQENIKSRLNEPNIKSVKISGEEVDKNEVEKSEPNDDDVHKLSQDLNGDEKREKENKSDDKEAGIKSVNEIIKGNSSGEINDDNHKENEPEFNNANDDKALNHEHENNAQSSQDLETVKLVRPENLKVEIKNPDQEEKKNEKDGASDSKESSDELGQNKEHKQEENYEAKELIGYNDKDKDKDNEKYEKSSETDSGSYHRDKVADGLDEKNLDTKLKDAVLKREDLTRKLLWVSDESESELKGDERRESARYKNRGEKSVERQAGFLKNIQASLGFDNNSDQSKFVKRSLMAAENNTAKADQNSVDPGYRGLKKREGIRFSKTDTDYEPCDTSDSEFSERSKRLEKRSSESHPENFYGYKKNALNLESRDQSLKKIVPPDLTEYGSEIEGYNLPQDDEDFRDNSAVKNDDDENQVESDIQFSDQDRDRDPMRDRINMLIKEKLEDRGKGKLMHFKREIDNRGENIEYYDYESGVNGVDSDVDSTVVENDPKIRDDNNNNNNCSYPEVAIDKAPETVTKNDENKEEERKEELEQEERNHKAPKEEFISDVELGKSVKKKPTFSKINAGLESGEKTYRRLKDNNFQESNTNSNSHWLGQPAEADTDQEIESLDRRGRYREIGESGKEEKSLENDKAEVFGEPLEYSVKVHGKLDPESIDAILNDNENAKDKELGDNDKLQIGTDRDWKYEGIRGKSRSRSGQRIGDYQFGRDQEIGDKSLARNFQYGENSARIEEGTNDRASIRNSINYDRIIKDESLYGNGDNRPSLEARLVDDSDQDTLPTMIDRSETRNLAPGERTYLVIAPPRIQYPEKSSEDKNSSSSSSSGSNYLALKITDDMFKGGIEQSNPTEDKIPDNNLMGKTTTEWKVIKMFEDGGSKPQNFALNPRDDVHESIVDPEEMIGDFDDDMRPRFGRDLKCLRKSHRHFARNLQSVSYPIDPFGRGDRRLDINGGEEPVDKYLKYSQKDFEKSETTGHRIKKRSVVLIDGKKAGENFNEDQKISGLDSGIKNFTGVDKNLEKRFSGIETSDGGNYTEIDKDKRGLTNVEEWEMNAPTVQKQLKNIETLSDNIGEKYNSDGKISEENEKISSSNSDNSVTSGSHEREIRSVKFKDENSKFDSFPASRESLYFNKMRSKIREKDKLRALKSVSRTKPFAKYVSSLDSNSQYNYDEINPKNDENYETSYDHDWKKLNPEENDEGKVRQLNTNDYWRLNQGRSKSEKEQRDDKPNHRPYQHNELEKENNVRNSGHGIRESLRDYNDPKTQLKTTKGHGERNFKDVEGASAIQNAKAHDKMSTHVMDSSQNKSSQGGEGYDKENVTERDKKVLEENAEDPVKPIPEVDEKQKKKFTVLLAADNMEDESQMDLALHGELAGKIVETIFDQVQKNDALKVALGPGLYRKHKSEDVVATDKIYRQGLDEDEVKHTEGMMRRVMELLGRLILDEVQRKTCASLPPDMKEFLQWMLGVEDDDKATDQIAPFPFVHNEEPNQRKEEKFLFENPSMRKENADVVELNKKVKLLRSLINEYNSLSDREKTKVQSVHDYLVRQLGLLIKFIDAKVAEGGGNLKTGRIGGGNILQYQNAVPNSNGTEVTESTLSPLVNTPSIMMLSNASFVEEPKAAFNHFVRSRFRETRSSGEKVEKMGKKRKHGKQKQPNDQERDQRKHKRKHKKKKKNKNKKNKKNKNKKKHQKQKGAQSPEYKKLIRRAAMLRKKRANIYGDNWDPIDSGYEEPMIYTSNGELTNKLKRSIWKQRLDDDEERNPKYWADVLSGKLDDEIIDDRDEPGFEKDLNFDTKIPDDTKNSSFSKEIKRDVIGTSIALQPWLNPRIDDLVSSDYLKELTNELVQGSVAPPIYPGDKIDGVRNVELKMTEGENIVNDELPMLSKRDVWKNENEEQLEEVAFGKDMRGKWKEKEQFKKLTEMDRKKNLDIGSGKRRKRDGDVMGNNSTSENNDAILNDGIKSDDFKTPVKLEVNKKNETVVSTDFENSNTLSMEEHDSVTERIEKDERSLKNKDFLEVLKNGNDKGIASGMSKSDVNYRHESDTKTYEKLNEKRSSPLLLPETEESAILPLLEISEQRQEQKQAGKTHNDDQRDIADQMLGFESPLITGLINTY